jgi:hypothetical protein
MWVEATKIFQIKRKTELSTSSLEVVMTLAKQVPYFLRPLFKLMLEGRDYLDSLERGFVTFCEDNMSSSFEITIRMPRIYKIMLASSGHFLVSPQTSFLLFLLRRLRVVFI